MWFRSSNKSARQAPSEERGHKRTADSEELDLVPASAPAAKLHKDASGDIATAATASVELPTDAAATVPAAAATVPQVELSAMFAKVLALEQKVDAVSSELAVTKGELQQKVDDVSSDLAATKDKLKQQEQNSIARENAIKDTHRQQVAELHSEVEFLSQRIRSKNMVIHGVPDTAALSKPADLERFVKNKFDGALRSNGPSMVTQSITAVTHMGRPGNGNRSVLVEYASSQAKHRAYAQSRELRRQGIHLSDELTPKQLQAQKVMEPDVAALRSKGYRPWFRHGTLWYSNRGAARQCRRGEALHVPACPPATAPPGPRANARHMRHPSARRRDNGVTANGNHVLGRHDPPRSTSPSYAQATRAHPAAPAAAAATLSSAPTTASAAPPPPPPAPAANLAASAQPSSNQ